MLMSVDFISTINPRRATSVVRVACRPVCSGIGNSPVSFSSLWLSLILQHLKGEASQLYRNGNLDNTRHEQGICEGEITSMVR
jgi:hypothetical protein